MDAISEISRLSGELPAAIAHDAARALRTPCSVPIATAALAGTAEGMRELPRLLRVATDAIAALPRRPGPLPRGGSHAVLQRVLSALGPLELRDEGLGSEPALVRVAQLLLADGLDLSHPHAAAHLQPPPLSVAVVADALASAGNASLDTYDSGPSAIAIEHWVVGVLARLAKLGPHAQGVLTPGGSISNLLGLLLARDAAAHRQGIDARRDGVAALPGAVVLCSELAHFSVHRACAALGLGEVAAVSIGTDRRRRMRPAALRRALQRISPAQMPLAIVATAGTTDFGSFDPLPEIAAIAAEYGVWLHVDAAYGFGALFSTRLGQRLDGIGRADSITLDLHKLGWQPAAASVLLVANPASFTALEREVAYLNPSDDCAAGLDGLLGRSLQTTRRPDAVKVAATLLAYGRRGMGEMVDTCHALARHAQQRIAELPELDLVAGAELTTVVFRYRARLRAGDAGFEDALNGALRRRLLEFGSALIGRSSVRLPGSDRAARVCLKLTLLNPTTRDADIDALLQAVVETGRALEQQLQEHVA